MPVIRKYERQVAEGNMPSIRQQIDATPDMFGAGVARAIGQAGTVATAIGDERKKWADDEAVTAASNELVDNYYNAVYGENGFINRKGDKAVGVSQEADQFFTSEFERIKGTLKNKQQIAKFMVHNRENMFNFKRNIFTHERNEKAAYEEAKDTAHGDKVVSLITLNPKDADSLMAMREREIVNGGQAKGMPKEAIEQKIQKFRTTVALSLFKIAEDNGDVAGMDRFSGMKGIDPVQAADMKRKTRNENDKITLEAEAQAIFDKIKNGDGTINEALKMDLLSNSGRKVRVNKPIPADAAKYFDSDVSKVSGTLVGNLARLAKDKGIKIAVNSGFRTREEQENLYNNRANNPFPVAAPGTSEHENGLAIDTNSLDGLSSEELAQYGIKRLEGDEIHYTAMNDSGTQTVSDPEYASKLRNKVNALAADYKHLQVDNTRKYRKEFFLKVGQAGNLTDTLKAIEDADYEYVTPLEKQQLIEKYQKLYEKLSGPMSDEDRKWTQYGKSRFVNDLLEIDEINIKLANLSPEEKLQLQDPDSSLAKKVATIPVTKAVINNYKAWLDAKKNGTNPASQYVEAAIKGFNAGATVDQVKEILAKKNLNPQQIEQIIAQTGAVERQ